MKAVSLSILLLGVGLCAGNVPAQDKTGVKITALGSHAGEYCAADRAMLFEDPTGVRILYDVGASVAGATDARLGDIHGVLLSHAHSDHLGGTKLAGPDAGTCAKPETVSAAPNSNTAEIAAAKNAAVITGNDMAGFLGKKMQVIRGSAVGNCAETGLLRVTTVPLSEPCLGGLQLGGKRTLAMKGQTRGVRITVVYAEHSNNVARNLMTDAGKVLENDNMTGYVGHANGYVLEFTNGLKVYLSGDTSLFGDMKAVVHDFHRVNLAVLNLGGTTMPSDEAAFIVNRLLQPAAVIPSHSSEWATEGGKLRAGSRTEDFVKRVKGAKVYLALGGRTREFNGKGQCTAGC